MRLEPRILTQLSGVLDLRDGKFFGSCFGHRVPDDLLAAVTVHGAATNRATAGFASPSRTQAAMPVELEHWDAVPPEDGDWDTVLRTQLCVDTSGSVEWFSPTADGPGEVLEFPMARGYYEVEAAARHAGEGDDRWRLRFWSSPEYGPDLAEIRAIAELAR
ncbi:hypothetical protein [Tsukamurella hominis]|uniref:hypothetical protein n=1 Tax=Tsukamurella hominis TaxID=1970232 RepID=UPI0039EA2138